MAGLGASYLRLKVLMQSSKPTFGIILYGAVTIRINQT